ncbi:YdeI/OmpD-associated family protein [Anaerotruncus colihominis]|uniref:YdeI/OmpD-associated family protein n=1 Tax=Anaerotruncus colihominis TaxID=169435 RepID=UPI000B397AB2|nr:YdeI/OmpD-associated family protein [Anaerotruncus colihominis]
MTNYVNGPEIPMGLGMALAENLNAMEYFASLSPAQQQAVIERTHQIRSKQEMRSFVQSLPSTPSAIG